MLKIVDNKIYNDGEKIGWIDGNSHAWDKYEKKLGYWQGNYIYNVNARKVAYIQENLLKFENGNASISLEKINEEIHGTYPLIVKCAVHVLFED